MNLTRVRFSEKMSQPASNPNASCCAYEVAGTPDWQVSQSPDPFDSITFLEKDPGPQHGTAPVGSGFFRSSLSGATLYQISIIIPIRNRSHEVRRIVKGLESQTCSSFEVIFVDDGSIDNTAKEIEAVDSPLRILALSIPHSGPSTARNRGAERATAPYLLFIDSDDRFVNDYIEQFSLAIEQPCRPQLIQAGVSISFPDGRDSEVLLPEPSAISAPVFRPFLSGTYCIDSDLFKSVGGFTEALRYAENRELALKLASSPLLQPERIHLIPKPLYGYCYRGLKLRAYNKEQAHAASYMLQHHRGALSRAGLVLTYHRLTVTNHAQAGQLRKGLKAGFQMLLEFPTDVATYITLLKIPYHVARAAWRER
jgi:glycosyltransferase involved in cell wall biosynthesis